MVTIRRRELKEFLEHAATNGYSGAELYDISDEVVTTNGSEITEATILPDHINSDMILTLFIQQPGVEIIRDRNYLDSLTYATREKSQQHDLSARISWDAYREADLRLRDFSNIAASITGQTILRQTSANPFGLISREGLWIRVAYDTESDRFKLQVEATHGFNSALEEIASKAGLTEYVITFTAEDYRTLHAAYPGKFRLEAMNGQSTVNFNTDAKSIPKLEEALGRKLMFDTHPRLETSLSRFDEPELHLPFAFHIRPNISMIIAVQNNMARQLSEREMTNRFMDAIGVATRADCRRADDINIHQLDSPELQRAFAELVKRKNEGAELTRNEDITKILIDNDPGYKQLRMAAAYASSATFYKPRQAVQYILSLPDVPALCRWYVAVLGEHINRIKGYNKVRIVATSEKLMASEFPLSADIFAFECNGFDHTRTRLPGCIKISSSFEEVPDANNVQEIRIDSSVKSSAMFKQQQGLLDKVGVGFKYFSGSD